MEEDLIKEAVYIENGIIRKVGNKEEIFKFKDDDTKLVDLKGHILLPGFIDGHSHLSATAYDLIMVNLKPSPSGNVNSIEDMKRELKDSLLKRTLDKDEWLMGMGYDNTSFIGRQEITKFDLDEVSKEIPIVITHASGHVGVCNSIALEKLGYVGNYMVPEGGVVRTLPGTNEPSGLLEENAFLDPKVKEKMGSFSIEKLMDSIIKAQELYASFGFTTVQDGFTDNATYPLLKNAASNHLLFLDVVSYIGFPIIDKLEENEKAYQDHYRLGGMKMFLDGSPQAKTAWLTNPYYIVPEGKEKDYCGFPIWTDDEVISYCKICLEKNLQLLTHCNGDAAIDQLLRCYKKAKEETNNNQNLRPVIIHAQTIRDDQLDKMKELKMIASFFLDHIYYWGDYHYESVLGKNRAEHISPAKSAVDRKITFTLHQDTPVVLPNTMLAIHNAVNRRTKSGRILGLDQRISVLDALKALTLNAAYQYFEEDKKGSIKEGKYADFVILEENPLEVDHDKLKDINVLETIKDGKTIYKK